MESAQKNAFISCGLTMTDVSFESRFPPGQHSGASVIENVDTGSANPFSVDTPFGKAIVLSVISATREERQLRSSGEIPDTIRTLIGLIPTDDPNSADIRRKLEQEVGTVPFVDPVQDGYGMVTIAAFLKHRAQRARAGGADPQALERDRILYGYFTDRFKPEIEAGSQKVQALFLKQIPRDLGIEGIKNERIPDQESEQIPVPVPPPVSIDEVARMVPPLSDTDERLPVEVIPEAVRGVKDSQEVVDHTNVAETQTIQAGRYLAQQAQRIGQDVAAKSHVFAQQVKDKLTERERMREKRRERVERSLQTYGDKEVLSSGIMQEVRLESSVPNLITFKEVYGEPALLIDPRIDVDTGAPVIIDRFGNKIPLQIVEQKNTIARGMKGKMYAMGMRFDSNGRSRYFEYDPNGNYHCRVEVNIPDESHSSATSRVHIYVPKDVILEHTPLDKSDPRLDICGSDYGYCQGSEMNRASLHFKKKPEDEVLLHLRTGDPDSDAQFLQNKIVLSSQPPDPITSAIMVYTDRGAVRIHPVIDGNKNFEYTKKYGVNLEKGDVVYHAAIKNEGNGAFQVTDGSRRNISQFGVDVFIVKTSRRSVNEDLVTIVDGSNGSSQMHAPFVSGVVARKLHTGERLLFDKRAIQMAPEIIAKDLSGQVFELPLGNLPYDKQVVIQYPQGSYRPTISYGLRSQLAGTIVDPTGEETDVSSAARVAFPGNDDDKLQECLVQLTVTGQHSLLRNIQLKKLLGTSTLPSAESENYFILSTRVLDAGDIEAVPYTGAPISGRTFIIVRSPRIDNPNQCLCLQLDPVDGQPTTLENAQVKKITPVEDSTLRQSHHLAYVSGTKDQPVVADVTFSDRYFYSPVIIHAYTNTRSAARQLAIERNRRAGFVIEAIDLSQGKKVPIRPIGRIGMIRVSPLVLDTDLRDVLHDPNLGITDSDRVYVVGIKDIKRGQVFCDLSTDSHFLAGLAIKRIMGEEIEFLADHTRATLNKNWKPDTLSKVIIIENRKYGRRTFVIVDRSRANPSVSSFSAGTGIAIADAIEQDHVADVHDYIEKVEKRSAQRQRRVRPLQAALGTTAAAALTLAAARPLNRDIRLLHQEPAIVYQVSADQWLLTGDTVTYRPIQNEDGFVYEGSMPAVFYQTDPEKGAQKTARWGLFTGEGQFTEEGAGAEIVGVIDLDGRHINLFASKSAVAFAMGGKGTLGYEPAIYTPIDIDGKLGYINDAGEVKLYEIPDINGNGLILSRTDFQLSAAIEGTEPLYSMNLANGITILVRPSQIRKNDSGILTIKANAVFFTKSNGLETVVFTPDQNNIQKDIEGKSPSEIEDMLFSRLPNVEDLSGKTPDELHALFQSHLKDGSARIINLSQFHYEPQRYTDSRGTIVLEKDLDMTVKLASVDAAALADFSRSPAVYRYYQNGLATGRFVIFEQGKIKEIARVIPAEYRDGILIRNERILYQKDIRVLPSFITSLNRGLDDGVELDSFMRHPAQKRIWTLAEVINGKAVVNRSMYLGVDVGDPDEITVSYKSRTARILGKGIYSRENLSDHMEIQFFDPYFRVVFEGISDQDFYVNEEQMVGRARFGDGIEHIFPDTVMYSDRFGEPSAYWIQEGIDRADSEISDKRTDPVLEEYYPGVGSAARFKGLHPPNIFVIMNNDGRKTYRYDNRYYIPEGEQGVQVEFDHLPALDELKNSLPEKESGRISDDVSKTTRIETSDNTVIAFSGERIDRSNAFYIGDYIFDSEKLFNTREKQFEFVLHTTLNKWVNQKTNNGEEFTNNIVSDLEKNGFKDIIDQSKFQEQLDHIKNNYELEQGQKTQCFGYAGLLVGLFGTDRLPNITGQMLEHVDEGQDPVIHDANKLISTFFDEAVFNPNRQPDETIFGGNIREIRPTEITQIHRGDFLVTRDNHVAFVVDVVWGEKGPVIIIDQANREKNGLATWDVLTLDTIEQKMDPWGSIFILRNLENHPFEQKNPEGTDGRVNTSGMKRPYTSSVGVVLGMSGLGVMQITNIKKKRRKQKNTEIPVQRAIPIRLSEGEEVITALQRNKGNQTDRQLRNSLRKQLKDTKRRAQNQLPRRFIRGGRSM